MAVSFKATLKTKSLDSYGSKEESKEEQKKD